MTLCEIIKALVKMIKSKVQRAKKCSHRYGRPKYEFSFIYSVIYTKIIFKMNLFIILEIVLVVYNIGYVVFGHFGFHTCQSITTSIHHNNAFIFGAYCFYK
jgi:hypothetical protein